jgi:hypothetical protein
MYVNGMCCHHVMGVFVRALSVTYTHAAQCAAVLWCIHSWGIADSGSSQHAGRSNITS